MKISRIKGILLLSFVQIICVIGYAALSIMKQVSFTWDNYSFMDFYTNINRGRDFFWTLFISMLLGYVLMLSPMSNSNRLLIYGSRKRIFWWSFLYTILYTVWSIGIVLLSVAAVSAFLGKPFYNWKEYGSYYNVTMGKINPYPMFLILGLQVFLLIIRGIIFGCLILMTSYKKLLSGLFLCITIGMVDFLQNRVLLFLRLTSLDFSFWNGSIGEKAFRLVISVGSAIVLTFVAYQVVKRREYV